MGNADSDDRNGRLLRSLGVRDAIVIGAGSMIGAGVFSAWSPAAGAAGSGLLVGLVVAGVVALCNATSSAQLAALHPESGGTYVYARHRLGPAWGHIAGWCFVVGKLASCAAMALTLGAYVSPGNDEVPALLAVAAITAVNIGGLTRTVAVTRVLLTVSLATLVLVVVSGWSGDRTGASAVWDFSGGSPGGAWGILQSAGFLFFAFAGYARVATLGEEVRDPERTIPRAVPLALGLVLLIYMAVAVTVLVAVPAADLVGMTSPLDDLVRSGPFGSLAPVVGFGAAIASLGVLLNLIPGISRTVLAMARNSELPASLARISPSRSLPLRAELSVATVVAALVLMVDIRDAIGISGVAVLTYYALTNAAALRLSPAERRWPAPVAVVGLVGCAALVASLPVPAILTGLCALVVGVGVRAVTTRLVSRRTVRP